METYGTVQERVARGVKWLDRHKKNWRNEVVVKELDMSDDCRCVLGQVFIKPAAKDYGYTDEDVKAGHVAAFHWVMERFANRRGSVVLCRNPSKYGFDCIGDDVDMQGYKALEREWKKIIKQS